MRICMKPAFPEKKYFIITAGQRYDIPFSVWLLFLHKELKVKIIPLPLIQLYMAFPDKSYIIPIVFLYREASSVKSPARLHIFRDQWNMRYLYFLHTLTIP